MSKLKEIAQEFKNQGVTISVYKPGAGFVLGKVTDVSDDVVEITPEVGTKFILHYTVFAIERD